MGSRIVNGRAHLQRVDMRRDVVDPQNVGTALDTHQTGSERSGEPVRWRLAAGDSPDVALARYAKLDWETDGADAGEVANKLQALIGDLAEAEKGHEKLAEKLTDRILSPDVRAEEDQTRRRMFVLQYVQPGLAGLMDG